MRHFQSVINEGNLPWVNLYISMLKCLLSVDHTPHHYSTYIISYYSQSSWTQFVHLVPLGELWTMDDHSILGLSHSQFCLVPTIEVCSFCVQLIHSTQFIGPYID
uniref:Uncharacterized protein n=1 Tax=Cacopsylla melanoneura TaxID=428564 RepID=A0A8D8U1U6_9HEMI